MIATVLFRAVSSSTRSAGLGRDDSGSGGLSHRRDRAHSGGVQDRPAIPHGHRV